jgi:hypothetical protein
VKADEQFAEVMAALQRGDIQLRVEQRHYPADLPTGVPPEICDLDILHLRDESSTYLDYLIVVEVDERHEADCR